MHTTNCTAPVNTYSLPELHLVDLDAAQLVSEVAVVLELVGRTNFLGLGGLLEYPCLSQRERLQGPPQVITTCEVCVCVCVWWDGGGGGGGGVR